MEMQPILKAVEWAILTVAEEDWGKFSVVYPDADRLVVKSLRSLQGLGQGVMPNYSENLALPLLYNTWYQPRQINLVYSILRDRRWIEDEWVSRISSRRLSVIDFGCGSLATQFAIAILAADTISRPNDIPKIRVVSYDTSLEMVQYGKRIWAEFARIVNHFYADHPIRWVLDQMDCKYHTDLAGLPKPIGGMPHLVTAIHAAYSDTAERVRDDLKALVSKYSPEVCLMTAQSTSVANHAWPLWDAPNYDTIQADRADGTKVDTKFRGVLKSLTDWRRGLYAALLVDGTLDGEDAKFVQKYLSNNAVRWEQWQDFPLSIRVANDNIPW